MDSEPVEETELVELWRTYRRTGDPNLRNFLLEAHMPLVRRVARRIQPSLPRTVELEDLTSAGTFGLMAALDQFDPDRGAALSSYCALRIRGAILDDLRKQDWVPRKVRKNAQRLDQATRDLEGELGRAPSEDELAEALDLTVPELQATFEAARHRAVVSMVSNYGDDGSEDARSIEQTVVDDNVEDPGERLDQRDLFARVTETLTRKERLILVMHYDEGKSLREIGELLKLTRSRVCQIHSNVKSRLQARFGEAELGEAGAMG